MKQTDLGAPWSVDLPKLASLRAVGEPVLKNKMVSEE